MLLLLCSPGVTDLNWHCLQVVPYPSERRDVDSLRMWVKSVAGG